MTVDGTRSHSDIDPSDPPPLRSPSHGTYSPPARRARQPEPARHSILTRRGRRVLFEVAATLASTALLISLPSSVQTPGPWSAPMTLAACSAPGTPAVVFPSDAPRHGTGPGGIVWAAAERCSSGAGPRVAPVSSGQDVPGPAAAPRTAAGNALGIAAPLAVAAGPHGRILVAGPALLLAGPTAPTKRHAWTSAPTKSGLLHTRTSAPAKSGLLVSEGRAGGPFGAPRAGDGPAAPLAIATAYLGDVALASPGWPGPGGREPGGGTGAIELRMHRYYASSFEPPVPVTGGGGGFGGSGFGGSGFGGGGLEGGGLEGLTLAMDYRSDALAAWERAGAVYTRFMPGSDRSRYRDRRVATAAPGARIAAVLSDDNRAILAWSETRAGITSVYAELSGVGVSFGGQRLLERFADPGGGPPPGGDEPRLVRLSSESVMLAWTSALAGHWTVRTAAVDLNGVRAIDTISMPGHDAVLTDLAPGPAGEAFALWTEPLAASAGARNYRDQALYAARGIDAYPGRTIFGRPQLVAPVGAAGTTGEASLGIDPDSDRAIVAWRTQAGAIDCSLHTIGGN